MNYRELQSKLKDLRNQGIVAKSFRLNQKKTVLMAEYERVSNVKVSTEKSTDEDEVTQLKARIAELERENAQLKAEMGILTSPTPKVETKTIEHTAPESTKKSPKPVAVEEKKEEQSDDLALLNHFKEHSYDMYYVGREETDYATITNEMNVLLGHAKNNDVVSFNNDIDKKYWYLRKFMFPVDKVVIDEEVNDETVKVDETPTEIKISLQEYWDRERANIYKALKEFMTPREINPVIAELNKSARAEDTNQFNTTLIEYALDEFVI